MRVLATAGHVDHGKSTLVQALTGVDPDRLPEEKARGLTVDLGFASATLPSGQEIAFVDVPGHGRFVGNMLAGAGLVDACVFVVAATEGWKEQSEEHLRILELFGISHGIVALTKVAAVEPGWAELVTLELRERMAGTFLAEAEVVEVDVPAGTGVDELRRALDRLVAATPAAADRDRPRLWVDRSFAVAGAGTVVTGTLRDGSLRTGMELTVEPGGRPARVRGLQSHNRAVDPADPGRRLAVNLAGVSRLEVGRGHALVRPGQWHITACFDARLQVLASLGHPVERRGAYRVHVGSASFPVRIRVLGPSRVQPGEEAAIRVWLPPGRSLPLLPGDRYVLRESGRFETVGGGEVLDVEPVRQAAQAGPDRSVARVVRERGWVDAGHLERITGQRIEPTLGRWVVDPEALDAARRALRERVDAAGPEGIDISLLDDRQRAVLAALEGVSVSAGRAVAGARAPAGLGSEAERVLAVLEEAGMTPPPLPLSDRGALRELQKAGRAVEAGELWFATSVVERAIQQLGAHLAAHPGGFTVGEARDVVGGTRRTVLPLLAYLDSIGATRRRGDVRTAGPRLARFNSD